MNQLNPAAQPPPLSQSSLDGTGESRKNRPALLMGFDILALAATFIASIQAQVMSTTVGIPKDQETVALRAINSLFLCGLVSDLVAAILAFLTARWLQRLTDAEIVFLEDKFEEQENPLSNKAATLPTTSGEGDEETGNDNNTQKSDVDTIIDRETFIMKVLYEYFATCLFAPMPLLTVGLMCMIGGLVGLAWSQQPTIVGVLLTVACLMVSPFVVGVLTIGRKGKEVRRKHIIMHLSRKRGDW